MIEPGSEAASAWLVARTDLRRTVRRYRGVGTVRALAGALVLLFYTAISGAIGLLGGTVVFTGDAVPTDWLRAILLVVLGLASAVVTVRTVRQSGSQDIAAASLPATTPRAVALGLVGAELVRAVSVVVIPLAALLAGVSLVVADSSGVVLLGAGLLGLLVLAVVAGMTSGFLLLLVVQSGVLGRYRRPLVAALALLALAGGAVAVRTGLPLGSVGDALLSNPVAWLADLAVAGLVGTPPQRVLLGAVGVLAVGIPVSVIAICWAAARIWLGSHVRAGGSSATLRRRSRLEALLSGRVPPATRRVAIQRLRTLRRSPATLLDGASAYLTPLGVLAPIVLIEGTVPDWTMYAFAGAGILSSGALFALNPIGTERALLPVTLTSGVDGRSFLGGVVLASWVVGPLATALAVVASGLLTGADLLAVAGTTLWASATAVCVPGIALAAGTAFPSFDTTALPGGRETVEASLTAVVVVLVALLVTAGPFLYLATTGRGPLVLALAGVLGVALTGVAGWYGFQYAVAAFEAYSPPARYH